MQNQGTDSPSREATFSVRKLTMADAASAMRVFVEVAPRIPIPPRNLTPEKIADFEAQLKGGVWNPYSLVATAQSGDVIGFLFAKLTEASEFFGEPQPACLLLAYVGVTETYRCKGVLRCLVETAMLHRLPLFAEVLPDNQSDMAARLPRLGFVAGKRNYTEGFWWRPIYGGNGC